jgi:hypothetical protein
MAREKDCGEHEGEASVEAESAEKLKEKWRWRRSYCVPDPIPF